MKYFLFLSMVVFNLCTQKADSEEWIDYETKDKIVKLSYPKNWSLDTSGKLGTDLLLFEGKDNLIDQFNENINLMVQNIGNNYDLDSFVKLSENQIRNFEGSKLYESKRVKLNGNEAQYLEYEANLVGEKDLRFTQYYVVKHGKAFLITYTCESTRFSETKDLAIKIMNSFEIN